ncbi:DUF2167 domain-containing protein [Rhodocytophaga rosea]|uniref:DUF2167 domain-containing protein n=1 Tax=Rhodocytophaga rosea TaxID=2704465 RepID=A0A6C0GQE1_9BACT|nr:DUF2167 domain-containing protein [Rhodocytophaga rosea]QHT70298.1 DUF2167 domain-containing protein [Rhodocytophaga rosea]
MKKTLLLFSFTLSSLSAVFAQTAQDSLALMAQAYQTYTDSINASMKYEKGTIKLSNGIATIKVPAGYKYLDAKQSNYVLTELWGNPDRGSSLGMLFPEHAGPMSDSSWCFNIEYDEIGYVEDDDAEDIDYEELLTTMKQEVTDANTDRVAQGYEKVELVGWASNPFYDADKKILHWAKEIKFGDSEENTLNYNVRVLGRKGVLILNAIASMNDLKAVKGNVHAVTDIVAFTDGNKYENFNPDVDQVAAYSIGGLVAGKVLAKVGFFAGLLKFWKVIAIAIAGAGTSLWKWFTGRRENDERRTLNQPERRSLEG